MWWLRKFAGLLFGAIGFALVSFRAVIDWTGRTTFLEDFEALQGKLHPMMEFLQQQPALLFYGILTTLILSAIALLIWDTNRFRSFVRGSTKRQKIWLTSSAAAPTLPGSSPKSPENLQAYDSNPWRRHAQADLERIESALYEMQTILSDAKAGPYDNARHVTGNFEAMLSSRRSDTAATLQACRDQLVDLINRLSDLVHRKYSLYSHDLNAIYDNVGFSNALGAINQFRILIDETPMILGATHLSMLNEKKILYDTNIYAFGLWIAAKKEDVEHNRRLVLALMAKQ